MHIMYANFGEGSIYSMKIYLEESILQQSYLPYIGNSKFMNVVHVYNTILWKHIHSYIH